MTDSKFLVRSAKQASFETGHWQGWADDIRSGRVRARPGLVTPEMAERNADVAAAACGRYLGQAYRARGL